MDGWLASIRLAWRDLRAQGRRSVFFALLIAVGVASLVGVQGAARTMNESVRTSAREMLQGDLKILVSPQLTSEQQAVLDSLRQDGAQLTETVETTGVAMLPELQKQSLVQVKLVDPKVWPFYGGFQAEGDKALAHLLADPGTAVVAPALLERLGVKVGDTFQLGKESYRITGLVKEEPQDLTSGSMPIGPRVIIAHDPARQSSAELDARTLLVRLPATLSAADAKDRVRAAFPTEREVKTYEDAWQDFAKVMDSVFTFLSMVALISLLVGGLGVAMAMRTFIQQKLEHIAVLKAVGATSGRVMTVFLTEALLLGALGSLLGVLLGLGVQLLIPRLLADLIGIQFSGIDLFSTLGGFAAGIATAVICALLPVRAVRNVKPVTLFRSEVGMGRNPRALFEGVVLGAVVLAGLGWLATAYAKSALVGFGFLGSLLWSALLLAGASWLFLKLLRLLPQSGRPTIRHAVRSLHAPGTQSTSVVVAMGLGITLMMTVYLLQTGLIGQVRRAGAGEGTPNLYLMGVTPEQRADVRTYLETSPDVAKALPPIVLVTNSSLVAIDGRPVAEMEIPSLFKGQLPLVASNSEVPQGYVVSQGEWFSDADVGKPVTTVEESVARTLNLQPGSTLRFRIRNEEVEFTVKSIIKRSGQGLSMSTGGPVMPAPGALDKYAESYMLVAITKAGREGAVVTELLTNFPGVMALGLQDLMNVIDSYMTKVANILRFMTGFALVAAGVILSGSLSATRFRRRKESALLKTLGASRATVATASALENGLLGFVAGAVGGGLGYAIVGLATWAMKVEAPVSLLPLLAAGLGGAILAMAVGFASTLDVLNVRPLSVLRGE